jgi:hypothetical protein
MGTGIEFLLSLVGEDEAERVRRRIGPRGREEQAPRPAVLVRTLREQGMPASGLIWLLEHGDAAISSAVLNDERLPDGLRRDLLGGVPFGGVRGVGLKVQRSYRWHWLRGPKAAPGQAETVGRLRQAVTMRQARAAAADVSVTEWGHIAAADREQPLPGYARWALATRIDCPAEVRRQFGTHRKFDHRLREAGVVTGPVEYAERSRPARAVLTVLDLGRTAFPARAAEAASALRPLVGRELGGRPEAWAVLAQLLPTFTGTLPELITTSGALTHTPP